MVTVIDFWAPWCKTCPAVHKVIDELKDKYRDVEFKKVNIEKVGDMDIARSYNIKSLPTILILKDGRPLWQRVGVVSRETLEHFIKGVLNG